MKNYSIKSWTEILYFFCNIVKQCNDNITFSVKNIPKSKLKQDTFAQKHISIFNTYEKTVPEAIYFSKVKAPATPPHEKLSQPKEGAPDGLQIGQGRRLWLDPRLPACPCNWHDAAGTRHHHYNHLSLDISCMCSGSC